MSATPPRVLPQPLLDALVEGRVLPLIGAGFSLNARLPAGRTMPAWEKLGQELEPEVAYATPKSDAVEVISTYSAEHGRQALVARLRKALHDGFAEPGDAHRALAQLPFDKVVTTNFDTLLEDAYRQVRRPLRPLIREDQLASLVPARALALIKAHGDFDNEPVLVATEQDYDEFLLRRPLLATYLANLLITRVALLIGYSLTDPDWRQLLASVRTRLGRSQQAVYAIERDAPPAVVERFRRRGVTVINLQSNGRTYENVLIDAFAEMRAHIAAHALDDSVVRDEGALEELRSAGREERRLCLFLLPERLLAYYREQVFPVVRQAGVHAITPFDVDAGGSIYATGIALMEEASAIVADVSGTNTGTVFELGLAVRSAAAKQGRLAVVGEKAESVARPPTGLQPKAYFFRSTGFDPVFPSLLAEWLTEVLGRPSAHVPGAAPPAMETVVLPEWEVVRAYRDLELALSQRLDEPSPLGQSLRTAERQRLLDAALVRSLREGYRVRNEVLHRGYVPTTANAREIVATVQRALRLLSA